MKIRITVGDDQKLNGYLNLDPISKFDDVAVDIRNLDEVAEDSECNEILADDVVGFLERSDALQAMSNWIKKLRKNGKIIITAVDAHVVSGLFYTGQIDLETFNKLLHGNLSAPWDIRLSNTTIEDVSEFLVSRGLVVTKKRQNGKRITIEAQRK